MLEKGCKELDTKEVLRKINNGGDGNMLNCVEMLQKDIRQSLKSAKEIKCI